MNNFLVKWVAGSRRVKCEHGISLRVLNLMMKHEITYWGLLREENGDMSFFVSEKDYKKLAAILDKYSMKVYSVYGSGLPTVIRKHKNRVGLLVGLALFFVIINLSSLFIWQIEVVDDTETGHNEILANLRELGCYEGAFVPSIDFEDLCVDYVDRFKDCSWISVNVRGTVARVEIREKTLHEDEETTPRNLIAAYGGIVEDCCVFSGRSHVESGSVVKKGDLLVSGIVENKEGAVRLCRARGEVRAIVDLELRCEVPYDYTKQVFTGKKYEKNSLRFFNLSFPLLSDSPKDDESCTYSKEENAVVLFEEIKLPLSMQKEVWREYTAQNFRYTNEEAKEAAQAMMKRKFAFQYPDAELISVETSGEETDIGYTMICRFKCRMDITEPAEIYT